MGYLTEEKRNLAGAITSLFAGVSGQVNTLLNAFSSVVPVNNHTAERY